MAAQGWDQPLTDVPRYGQGEPFRIMTDSEMMPSPWIGWRPYGKDHHGPRRPEFIATVRGYWRAYGYRDHQIALNAH